MSADRIRLIKDAAEARSNLGIFYAVIALLEGGTITGSHSSLEAERIIKICRRAAQRQLYFYDDFVERADVS